MPYMKQCGVTDVMAFRVHCHVSAARDGVFLAVSRRFFSPAYSDA